MSLRTVLAATAAIVTLAAAAAGTDRNPSGEGATYRVDRDSVRTSLMVQGRSMSTIVMGESSDDFSCHTAMMKAGAGYHQSS